MEATLVTHNQRMDAKKRFGRHWSARTNASDAVLDVSTHSQQEDNRSPVSALLAIVFGRCGMRRRQPARCRSAVATVASGKTKPATGKTPKGPPKRTPFRMVMKYAPTPPRATSKLTGPPLPGATTALPKLGAHAQPSALSFEPPWLSLDRGPSIPLSLWLRFFTAGYCPLDVLANPALGAGHFSSRGSVQRGCHPPSILGEATSLLGMRRPLTRRSAIGIKPARYSVVLPQPTPTHTLGQTWLANPLRKTGLQSQLKHQHKMNQSP